MKKVPFWHTPAFAIVLLIVLALLLNWPYLKGPFFLDDIFIYNAMRQDPVPFSWWEGAWTVEDHDGFENLWWKDPDAEVSFWRPIPSLVIQASISLFDRNAFPLHLLSILLHGAVAAGLYLLVRNLTNRHWLALLAGLFFVTCDDHSMGVGWIATITDLFCVFFILLALLGHIAWLKRRKPIFIAGSIFALIIAMGCKETGIIAPVTMVLLTFFMPMGTDYEGFQTDQLLGRGIHLLNDLWSWLPSVIVLILYLVMYKGLGLGVMNNLLYTDPFVKPGLYLTDLVIRLPVFWLGTFSPSPIYFPNMDPTFLLPMAVPGFVVFAAWLIAIWPFRRQAIVVWALILYIVALLPQACTDASTRGLYFPMIPASILIASVALSIGPLAKRLIQQSSVRPWWTRFMGWMALIGILVPGFFISATGPMSILPSLEKLEKDMSTVLPYLDEQPHDHVVILNTSSFLLSLYTWDYLYYLSDQPEDVWLLSATNGIVSIERTGNSSFMISTDRPGWLGNFIARVMRANPEFYVGQTYEKDILTATVIETTEDYRDVLAVRFDFNKRLSDPSYLFLRWNELERTFEPFDIAGLDIGESFVLADTSNIWKTMQ